MSSSSESPGKSDGLVTQLAQTPGDGVLGDEELLRPHEVRASRHPGPCSARRGHTAAGGRARLSEPTLQKSLSLLGPAWAWRGPGHPWPPHCALKIGFFWAPKGRKAQKKTGCLALPLHLSTKYAKTHEGKVPRVSLGQLRSRGGGSEGEDRGDRGSGVEKEERLGRLQASGLGGPVPTRETWAQGDGTWAAHGSDTQQRWPRAAGSRRPGEAKKEEVAVTAGGRSGEDTLAGPYLSRRRRRRRRRSSG